MVFLDFAVTRRGKLAQVSLQTGSDGKPKVAPAPINLVPITLTNNGVLSNNGEPEIVNSLRENPSLTVTAGYFENGYNADTPNLIAPKASPVLLDGSDGLLHLYFRNKDERISAIQYSATAKQFECHFEISEQQSIGGDDKTFEMGKLVFVAKQPTKSVGGTATPVIEFAYAGSTDAFGLPGLQQIGWRDKADTVSGLYIARIRDMKNTPAYWYGLPRYLPNLVKSINGLSKSDPTDDQYYLSEQASYFDGSNERFQLLVPEYIDPSKGASSRKTLLLSPKAKKEFINVAETSVLLESSSAACNPYATGRLTLTSTYTPWFAGSFVKNEQIKYTQDASESVDYIGMDFDPLGHLIWAYAGSLFRKSSETGEVSETTIKTDYTISSFVMSKGGSGTVWLGANKAGSDGRLYQFGNDPQYGSIVVERNQMNVPDGIGDITALAFDERTQTLWVASKKDQVAALRKYLIRDGLSSPGESVADPELASIDAMAVDDNSMLCIAGLDSDGAGYAKLFNMSSEQFCSATTIDIPNEGSGDGDGDGGGDSDGVDCAIGAGAMISSALGIFYIGLKNQIQMISFIDPEANSVLPIPGLAEGAACIVQALQMDEDSGQLWFVAGSSSADSQLYVLEQDTVKSVDTYLDDDTVSNPLNNTFSKALALHENGGLWVMNTSGNSINAYRFSKDMYGKFQEVWDNIPMNARAFTRVLSGKSAEPGKLSLDYDYTQSSIKRINEAGTPVSMKNHLGITGNETGLDQGSVLFSVIPIDAEGFLQAGTYDQTHGYYKSQSPYYCYGACRDYTAHLGQVSEDAYNVDLTPDVDGDRHGPAFKVSQTDGQAPKFLPGPKDIHSIRFSDTSTAGHSYATSVDAVVSDDDFPVGEDLTMEMWLKPDDSSEPYANLLSRGNIVTSADKRIAYGLQPGVMGLGFGMRKTLNDDPFLSYVVLPSFSLPETFTMEFWARLKETAEGSNKRTIIGLAGIENDNKQRFVLTWQYYNNFRVILYGKEHDFNFNEVIKSSDDLIGYDYRYRVSVKPKAGDSKKAIVTCTITRDGAHADDPDRPASQTPPDKEFSLSNQYTGVTPYYSDDGSSEFDLRDHRRQVWRLGMDYHNEQIDDNFIGILQEFRIWSGLRLDDLDENKDLEYDTELLNGNGSGLIAYYPLFDGPGAKRIYDASGNGYHGLPQGPADKKTNKVNVYDFGAGFVWTTPLVRSKGTSDSHSLYAGSIDAPGFGHAPILRKPFGDWSHLSAVCKMGYQLDLGAGSETYINFGNHSSLNPRDSITLSATVQVNLSEVSDREVIVSKMGDEQQGRSYELYITPDGRFGAKVYTRLAGTAPSDPIQVETEDQIPSNQDVNLVATLWTDSEITADRKTIYSKVRWEMVLYVNGNVKNSSLINRSVGGSVIPSIIPSSANLIGGAYYNAITEKAEDVFSGKILDLAYWDRGLSHMEIENLAYFEDFAEEGLVSRWRFNEGNGDAVHDSVSNNEGSIIRGGIDEEVDFWSSCPQKSEWQFYVNGEAIRTTKMDTRVAGATNYGSVNSFNPWIDDKLHVGDIRLDEKLGKKLLGNVDEIRLWSTARTQEELYTYAQKPLNISNLPESLIVYWNFDGTPGLQPSDGIYEVPDTGEWYILNWASEDAKDADEDTIEASEDAKDADEDTIDARKDAMDGRIAGDLSSGSPGVLELSGPASPESPDCIMALGTQSLDQLTYPLPKTAISPLVYEYGDLVLGGDLSVSKGLMKRGYLAFPNEHPLGKGNNIVVGDLEVIYVGQAQMNPTLIGYIEGPPPLPSENLTVMERTPRPDDYTGTASIELSESKNVDYSFSANRDSGFTLDFSGKIGEATKSEISVIKFFIEKELHDHDAGHGIKASLSHVLSTQNSASKSANFNQSQSTYLENVGAYEDVDADGNGSVPYVGRRYVPSNVGSALVKSATGNLYGLRLKDTGALVSYELVPNPDIPVDWNIIVFPINPDYTKNGTLDGMIGFTPDPNYPGARIGNLGSYFKPKEAYQLKREIERETKSFQAAYEQYDAVKVGQRMANGGVAHYQEGAPGDTGQKISESLPDSKELGYDFDQSLARKSLVNTYVWTADGGLFAEEEQYHASRVESFGGGYSLRGSAGYYFAIDVASGSVGAEVGFDLLFGGIPECQCEQISWKLSHLRY